MLEDVAYIDRIISYVSPKPNGKTTLAWERIKKALVEGQKPATNSASAEIALVVKCLEDCGCSMSPSTREDCVNKLNAVIARLRT